MRVGKYRCAAWRPGAAAPAMGPLLEVVSVTVAPAPVPVVYVTLTVRAPTRGAPAAKDALSQRACRTKPDTLTETQHWQHPDGCTQVHPTPAGTCQVGEQRWQIAGRQEVQQRTLRLGVLCALGGGVGRILGAPARARPRPASAPLPRPPLPLLPRFLRPSPPSWGPLYTPAPAQLLDTSQLRDSH